MSVEHLDFGMLEYYDNYVVGTMNSGINFDRDCVDTIIESLNRNFAGEPFAYISHRIHDYSLNPTEVQRMVKETNIIAAAFVLVRRFSYESFQTEKIFYKIPTAAFSMKEEAVKWVQETLSSIERSKATHP